MDRDEYNTRQGIARHLGTLADFHELILARYEAWYERREPLSEFLVLGRWRFDTCGNFQQVINGPSPKDLAPGFPDVLPMTDFDSALRTFGIATDRMWRFTGTHLPKVDSKCSGCGDGWTMADTFDAIARFDYERDVRLFYHRRCHRATLRAAEEAHFRHLFKDAGIEVKSLEAIPNHYDPSDEFPPWFKVETTFGAITIGWRKRVIEIIWSATGRDLSRLFKDEDVTKGPHYIHAWGTKKAVEYLKRIRKAQSSGPKTAAASAS